MEVAAHGQPPKVFAAKTSAQWRVLWHPRALTERDAIGDARECVAVRAVIEKLLVDGPALAYPHQSAVMGTGRSGLRELRPRRGRSRWRPIYCRLDSRVFAIVAVGPEAGIDKLDELDHKRVIVLGSMEMDPEKLIPDEKVLARDLQDPEFRAEWERTAVARWLAVEVAHYRAVHGLSQRQLASLLDVHQSDVARMESGEHTPTLDRLIRVAKGLDIELMIDIRPQKRAAKLPRKRALEAGSFALGGCEVIFATA